ncbi:MAG: hypothetical protein HYV93_21580 [Candidatus Rokubacteria bacterium]|nr:hypothetical protein [Candidatus Rokubacteria bacterium]
MEATLSLIERRWQAFGDLRGVAEIRIQRDGQVLHLAGVLLLRAPASLRFEALSPFGPPILLVSADPDRVTIWEIIRNRAFILPSSPEANRRWLGLALGSEDLVALLAGRVRPLGSPLSGAFLPADDRGPSLSLTGRETTQRLWVDPDTGVVRQVEYTRGRKPLRVVITGSGPAEPPSAVTLASLDGTLEVSVTYRRSQIDTGFDPDLLKVTVPEGVEIQDFR